MKVCTCFLLFGIFAYTHSSASNTPKSNQKSVNLALETVLEFGNKDKEADLKFLKNVQNFITKVKTVIDENSNGNNLRRNLKAPRVKTFTEFIQYVIQILHTYEAFAFAEFFDILDEEIRNYHYRGCRFHELTENYEIGKLIAGKLDSIKGKPTSIANAYINAVSDMLKDENYDRNVKGFVDYINSLYKQEAAQDFQKVITDLEAYGRSKSKSSNNNLGKIIKNGVRSIIFDHYSNLNTNVRRDVKEKIETLWKQLDNKTPSRGKLPNVKSYSNSRNNAKNSESIHSRKDLMNLASKRANKNIEVTKRHENNREIKRNDEKNEKKRYKQSRKGIINEPLDTQEKETRLSSQHTGPTDQQKTKNVHQEHSNTDSFSVESFSSIEFYQEPQHNTKQYTTIIPKKKFQKPPMNVSKKSEKIEPLNMTTRMPKKNIWIEESTRRLPQAVLDKLAVKPRRTMTEDSLNKHGPRHKNKYDKDQKKCHGKIYEPKYEKYDKTRITKYWSKNDTKYASRQKQKPKQEKKHKNVKTSEPNDPFILVHNTDFVRQNFVRTTDSVFIKEVHQYKKSLRPLRVELKQNKGWTTASTKPQKFLVVLDALMPSKSGKTIKSPHSRTVSPRVKLNEIRRTRQTQQTSSLPPTNSSMGRLSVSVPRAYYKRNKMVPWKSADHPSSSSEAMTIENFEIKEDKRRHGQNDTRTSSSLEKDPYVIERIKNLERQLNEVNSGFNVDTDVVKARKAKHSYVAKDNIEKRKQFKTRFRSDVNMIPNDFKDKTDKPKMAGIEIADNKTERILEYKNVQGENSTNKEIENNLDKRKTSETRFRSYINLSSNDSKVITDKTEVTQIEDNKADVKDIDFENKEEIINNDHQTMEVNKQQAMFKEDKKTETGRTNIFEVTPKEKDRGIKVMMYDHDADDASNERRTQNNKIASLSTSTKATESTTKTTTTVQPTVAITTPSTPILSTISVSTLVTTSPKLTNTKEINKEVTNNNATSTVTSVTNTTKLESAVTSPTVVITRSEMVYTEASYYEYPVPPDGKSKEQLDPFGHTSDGFVLNV